MRKAAGLVAAIAVFAAAFVLFRVMQEANYGTGARAGSAAIDGPSREIAFVSNGVGGTVTMIDIEARTVAGEINVIPDGAKVGVLRDVVQGLIGQKLIEQAGLNYAQDTDLSPDGTILYVSRGHLGDVAAFDIATEEILWRTPIGGARADHMAISPDGARLSVSDLTENRVEVLDAASGARKGKFRTGVFPHDNHFSHDGARLYNASLGDVRDPASAEALAAFTPDDPDYPYLVTVVSAEGLDTIARHRFETGVRPFAVTKDERMIYAQLSDEHAVIAYDLGAKRIVMRLNLPVKDGVTPDDWEFAAPHHGLALTADEATLCLAGRASDYAAIVGTADLSLEATVPLGDGPSWAELAGDDRYCIFANNRSDDVSIVELATATEIARLPVGRAPKHITVDRVSEQTLNALTSR